jgi:hypothetical protein
MPNPFNPLNPSGNCMHQVLWKAEFYIYAFCMIIFNVNKVYGLEQR